MKIKGERYYRKPVMNEKVEQVTRELGMSSKVQTSGKVAAYIMECLMTCKKLPNWICEAYGIHFDCGAALSEKVDENGVRWVCFVDDKLGRMNIRWDYFLENYMREEKVNPYKQFKDAIENKEIKIFDNDKTHSFENVKAFMDTASGKDFGCEVEGYKDKEGKLHIIGVAYTGDKGATNGTSF